MRLEELVDQHYQQLSANDRELVTSIFREKAAISAMNSTQAAAFLHMSRTTLVRLLKKLGLDTYAQFKLLLTQKEHAGAESRFNMPEIAENYRLLLNELKSTITLPSAKCYTRQTPFNSMVLAMSRRRLRRS